jgi:hypothetical protein
MLEMAIVLIVGFARSDTAFASGFPATDAKRRDGDVPFGGRRPKRYCSSAFFKSAAPLSKPPRLSRETL